MRAGRRRYRGGIVNLSRLGLSIFNLPPDRITRDLVLDTFARGAYSYATLKTREAQAVLRNPNGGAIYSSGEAMYDGRDMGTVEAALATGKATAQAILATSQ